ncbi:unnamed protein product [Allacma fusca]|uniref:Sodefrin-like factor n=1 Tax=Allacma fusca TaxID=39272 RepID=A0A8J2J585_9HEXA|nr:unnamed protein product [Allacma fusca]
MHLVPAIAFILIVSVEHTVAMRCLTCSYSSKFGGSNTNCKVDPSLEPLQDADEIQDGQMKAYCLTEMNTDNGTISVKRSVYYSERRDLDGKCDEGPMPGKDPESYYVKSCYCASDKCNKMAYTPPPKINSVIKCHVCGPNDPNCQNELDNTYLVNISGVPYYIKSRSTSTTIFPGFNIMGVREAKSSYTDNQSWNIEWTTYCLTTILNMDEGVQIYRNATWSKDSNLHNKCEASENSDKIQHCYCNDKDGCNNRNKAPSTGLSYLLLVLTVLATAFSNTYSQ